MRSRGWPSRQDKFICHLCGATMVCSAKYYHLENVHKIGAKEHKCEVCGKVTLSKRKHLGHLRMHSNERPFVCPHCGKTFRHKNGLDTCVRRCTGLGVFECSICSRTFTVKQRLKHHELLHKGIIDHELGVEPVDLHMCLWWRACGDGARFPLLPFSCWLLRRRWHEG